MARPIEPTPILSGKDAERFLAKTLYAENHPDPVKGEFLRQCYAEYLRNTRMT